MQEDIHPKSYPTCFVDVSTGTKFLTFSTKKSKSQKTEVIDGIEYQVDVRDITSASHPAYTGQSRFVDTAGRIQKFAQKFSRQRK
ncbi:MAG: 50S ribosomal protein L31 [Verrucomicrobia bacterium]|nr:MAG: 50S ribosomal protein L31 [Verrucomicrobiota bacterium]